MNTDKYMDDLLGRTFDAIPSAPTKKNFPILITGYGKLQSVFKQPEVEKLLKSVMVDQKNSGSCVGQAFAKAITIAQFKLSQRRMQFSPWWIWMNRPNGLHKLLKTEGTSPIDQAKMLAKDGTSLFNQYEMDTSLPIIYGEHMKEFDNVIKPMYENAAIGYKPDYYMVPQDESEIKQAILDFGSACIMIPIYSSYREAYDDGQMIIPDVEKESLYGYHEVVLFEWDELGFRGHNSYGNEWGNDGFFHMPYDYPFKESIAFADNSQLSWADEYFYYLWTKGITLYERNFSDDITRGESLAIIARMQAEGESNIWALGYTAETHWADVYFNYLNDYDTIITEKNFDNPITRGEFMTILYRVLTEGTDNDVLDRVDDKHWAEVYYDALISGGMTIHETAFDEHISRGEVMTLIARHLGYKE